MKPKTFIRSAARAIGMDAGNLSKLAEKFGTPIDDKAALIALGREHQREPGGNERLVPMDIVEREVRLLCAKYGRQYRKHHTEGAAIIEALRKEVAELRQQLDENKST